MKLVFAFALALVSALAHGASVYIEDLTWTEVRDAIAQGKKTAIVYAGSTEQKGPHMAIGAHSFVAYAVGGRIARKLGDALVYPIIPFAPTGDPATRTGHMHFPGSVSLTPDVFASVVREVAQSAIAAGFKQVYLMADHGEGQTRLKAVAEELDAEWANRGVLVRYVPDLYFKSQQHARAVLASRGIEWGTHAGAWDTSELMALDKSRRWIRRDKLARSDMGQMSTTGVDGDPTKASAELGNLFLDYKVTAAVSQIRTFRSGAAR